MTLAAAPTLWLALGSFIGEQVFLCWALVSVGFIIALLAGTMAGPASGGRRIRRVRAALSVLGPLFWGGLLALIYGLCYFLLFYKVIFFAR